MGRPLRACALAVTVLLLLSCLSPFAEAKLRLPYTTPVLQTKHPPVVHPETGSQVAVFPVNFSVSVAECFAYPIELVSGFRLRGAEFFETHVFTGANLKLVFDVPNPGLDFVMSLTSADYPLLQDQYGSLWKPLEPLNLEVVKQESKYTYDVGSVGTISYQSQSESVAMPVGTPQYDYECYRARACCGLNTTNYRKYALVDSPVPPYACTNISLSYTLSYFWFHLQGRLNSGEARAETECELTANQDSGDSMACFQGSMIAVEGVSVTPQYSTPSPGFMLCRQGSSLVDQTYVASPIPVVASAFCSTSTCIGYTARNYMTNRLQCREFLLGYYTSLDGNNSNQFSYYEHTASGQMELSFPHLSWIDDVGMSSATAIQNISFQRDVPASTGWTLTYGDFPLPLTDTLQPLFPIGRPTRLSARFDKAPSPAAILVEVEYVSFSNFTSASWTIRTCVGKSCSSSLFPAAAEARRYPTRMNATVSLTSLGATTQQLLPSEVVVTVRCLTTPVGNPFRTLLAPSTIAVAAAIRPSSTTTISASAARDPLQVLPSPYAASLGGSATSRILCQGDYRFSTTSDTCVPLTNAECAVKYRGRRIVFNTTANACICRAPKLTSPLVYIPLPDPLPPPRFTEEDVRALMKALRLPRFMQTMEQAFEVHDTELAGVEGRSTCAEGSPCASTGTADVKLSSDTQPATAATDSATTSETKASGPLQVSRFYELTICCFILTGLAWVFILFRDVIYKLAGIGPWPKRRRNVKQPPAPPPTPASDAAAATAAGSTSPEPTSTPPPSAAANPAPQTKKPKEKKTKKSPQPATASAAPSSSPCAPPKSTSQSFTPSPRSEKHASASHKRRQSRKKEHSHPRRRPSRESQSPHAARQTPPTWYDAPPPANASAFPPAFDDYGFTAGHHTPFGYAPDDGFPRDEYTSWSARGDGGGDFVHFHAYEYVPVPPTYAEDPEEHRWYSFPAAPPRTPPTHSTSWGEDWESSQEYGDTSIYPGHVRTANGPFESSRSAAARSMQSEQPSPFGPEQYPARPPVRYSSRVEVISSTEGEEMRSASELSVVVRTHRLESID